MRYRKLGLPIPVTFSEKQQEYVDDNQFDFPPQMGGEFGRDILLASPGGLASTAHHWTGGFYGKGGSSSDKFIGRKNDPYLSGEYGNLYSSHDNKDLQDSFEILPYAKLDLPNDDNNEEHGHHQKSPVKKIVYNDHGKKKNVSFWWATCFVFLLIAIYFVLNLWVNTGMGFLKKLNPNSEYRTTTLLFLSIAGTIFLILLCWLLGVSFLSTFENDTV